MFNSLEIEEYNTEELDYALTCINPVNTEIYKIAYSIAKNHNSDFIDEQIKDMYMRDDTLDSSFKSLHISTVFKEALRNAIADLGVDINGNPSIVSLLDIFTAIDTIKYSEALPSILLESNRRDMDLYTISSRVGVPLEDYMEYLRDTDKLVETLYQDEMDNIVTEE